MAYSSPRASLDHNHHHTHAPTFVQNLSSRFLHGSQSDSSSISSNATPSTSVGTPTDRDKAGDGKDVKRYLASIIREDWDYPSEQRESVDFLRNAVAFHTREIGESDLESEQARPRKKSNDPYRFENPDAIGTSISDRKRKRRDLEEEELRYNSGLRIWSQRRDAWTGAVMHRPTSHKVQPEHVDGPLSYGTTAAIGTERGSSASTTGSSDFIQSPSTSDTTDIDPFDKDGPYLPVVQPLFPPSHPLRSRINPKSYATLYSKVVVKGLTPNIPVPLNHMIGALVEGWKADGEWPPRPSAVPAQDVKKGKLSTRFSKWRGEQEDQKGTKGKVKQAVKSLWRRESDPLKGVQFEDEHEGGLEEDLTLNKNLLEGGKT